MTSSLRNFTGGKISIRAKGNGGMQYTYRNDASAGAHGADVEHKHFILAQLGHLALLLAALHATA